MLRPWLTSLLSAGYEVHVACADGPALADLTSLGITVHSVPLRRSFNPFANLPAIAEICALVRRERFDVVNTHTPVGAAVGRIGCWLGGQTNIVYTVHGFYFHDDMSAVLRTIFIAIERMLGRITKRFMFVSDEDHTTALQTGIVRESGTSLTINNGVNLDRFYPPVSRRQARVAVGLPPESRAVGIVARVVREKGYIEFVDK